MTASAKSDSYRAADCCGNCDCYALGHDDDEPCWGQVSVIDDVENGYGGWDWLHACKGHRDAWNGDGYTKEGGTG